MNIWLLASVFSAHGFWCYALSRDHDASTSMWEGDLFTYNGKKIGRIWQKICPFTTCSHGPFPLAKSKSSQTSITYQIEPWSGDQGQNFYTYLSQLLKQSFSESQHDSILSFIQSYMLRQNTEDFKMR